MIRTDERSLISAEMHSVRSYVEYTLTDHKRNEIMKQAQIPQIPENIVWMKLFGTCFLDEL